MTNQRKTKKKTKGSQINDYRLEKIPSSLIAKLRANYIP